MGNIHLAPGRSRDLLSDRKSRLVCIRCAILLALLTLWLNERTKMTSSLVIFCPGFAVYVSTPRVVALPRNSFSRSDVGRCLDSPDLVA